MSACGGGGNTSTKEDSTKTYLDVGVFDAGLGTTQFDELKKDFETIQDNLQNAESTHDVQYIEDLYKVVHDMDYYLLRYGPEDVAIYVDDSSTISKYYGVLNVYK